MVCSGCSFLEAQKKWYCSLLLKEFPHKRASLSEEVVKSWCRSGVDWLPPPPPKKTQEPIRFNLGSAVSLPNLLPSFAYWLSVLPGLFPLADCSLDKRVNWFSRYTGFYEGYPRHEGYGSRRWDQHVFVTCPSNSAFLKEGRYNRKQTWSCDPWCFKRCEWGFEFEAGKKELRVGQSYLQERNGCDLERIGLEKLKPLLVNDRLVSKETAVPASLGNETLKFGIKQADNCQNSIVQR